MAIEPGSIIRILPNLAAAEIHGTAAYWASGDLWGIRASLDVFIILL
jgi:hypothetical protein